MGLGPDSVERRHHTERAIILHAEIAIFRRRVLPGHHEDRVALLGEVFDKRIVRREVQDVVFHDPRRHDQHRLGSHFRGCRRIADQFDQPVTIDDPAGGHSDIAADHEIFDADRFFALRRVLPVLDQVAQSADQIRPTLLNGAGKHFGVRPEEVCRREHVEHLARRERDDVLVGVGNAANAGGGGVPPLLIEQEPLIDRVKGPILPRRAGKPLVLRQWLDAARRVAACQTAPADIIDQPRRVAHRLGRKPDTLARCGRDVRRPIEISQSERRGRQACRVSPDLGMQRAIKHIGKAGRRSGIAFGHFRTRQAITHARRDFLFRQCLHGRVSGRIAGTAGASAETTWPLMLVVIIKWFSQR
jgi:hypothetical protein